MHDLPSVLPANVFEEFRADLFVLLRQTAYRERRQNIRRVQGGAAIRVFDPHHTTLTNEGAVLLGRLFLHLVVTKTPGVVAIGSASSEADPIMTSMLAIAGLARRHPKDGFTVSRWRKNQNPASLLRGGKRIPNGAEVAIVSDVVTTGNSTIRAIDAARKHVIGGEERNFKPSIVLVLVDRCEADGLARVKTEVPNTIALYTIDELSSTVLRPFSL